MECHIRKSLDDATKAKYTTLAKIMVKRGFITDIIYSDSLGGSDIVLRQGEFELKDSRARDYIKLSIPDAFAPVETVRPDFMSWQGLSPQFVQKYYAKPVDCLRASDGPWVRQQKPSTGLILNPWDPVQAARIKWGPEQYLSAERNFPR